MLLISAVGIVLAGRHTVPVSVTVTQRSVVRTHVPTAIFPGLSDPPEPTLADFAVSGAPQIVRYKPGSGAGGAEKPVLLYLPGIELSGYSAHRQYESLSVDYDVRYLAVPSDDRSSFEDLVEVVRGAVEEAATPSRPPRPAAAPAADANPLAATTPAPAHNGTPTQLAEAGPDARAPPAGASAAPLPPPPAAPAELRPVFLCGESFGGVLALTVALGGGYKQPAGSYKQPPAGLAGLVLINPATNVGGSWAARLPALLDALERLPAESAADAAYAALAAPIISAISGDPLQLSGRRTDTALPAPLRRLPALWRMGSQLPLILTLPDALPRGTLAYRLPMLVQAAKDAGSLPLSRLRLPVQIVASTDDRVLASVQEARRLVAALPDAQLTRLEGSGHIPLLEARVNLADILRRSKLAERAARGPPKPKDWVSDYTPPSAEAYANASASLLSVRRLTSPVFLSTKPNGERVTGLSGLPPLARGDGPPILIVGNHQLYGFQDLPLLVEEVYRSTGVQLRSLAHPVIFSGRGRPDTQEGQGADADVTAGGPRGGPASRAAGGDQGSFGAIDYSAFGAVPVSPRALFKLLKRGEPTLLYPGGVREAFKSTKKGEAYKLFWPNATDSADFAPVAARFNATIVPVAAIGAEDGFRMLADADELLATPFLGQWVADTARRAPVGRPGERFVTPVSVPTLPHRWYFLFGPPIDTSAVDPTDEEACKALYSTVRSQLEDSIEYLLRQRELDPYEPLLPRAAVEASWNWTRQAPTFKL